MSKNEILSNIKIEKLILGGKGLGIAPDGRKIIISGGCIPGSIVDVRVLKARKSHYEGQQTQVVKKSPIEIPLPEGFQMYGGAKWLTIGYEDQLLIKQGQVQESFFHIQEFIREVRWHAITPSPEIYGYRNKVEFSWGKYISDREGIHDDFRFGFHVQAQFDRIEDCTYCALADEETNAIFQEINTLSRASGLPTYDPKTQEGFWRHLVIRKAKKTGEVMLIFSVNSEWSKAPLSRGEEPKAKGGFDSEKNKQNPPTPLNRGAIESFFTKMVQQLTKKFTHIASIFFLENTGRADIVTGNPIILFGKPNIVDELLSRSFEIQPKSFFQVNTLGAELLYTKARDFIQKKGGILLDLYAGTGTIGILISDAFDTVYSVELVADASMDGARNASRNGIKNVQFINKKVEDFAKEFYEQKGKADTIILDPPRDGLHPSAIEPILSFGAGEIIYVSCNPATLSRDLETFVGKNRTEKLESLPKYRITDIAPFDMFPHTHHIETVVRLEKV